MRKIRNKIITSFFCLLLAVSTLAGLLLPDRYYSEREKRTLTQKPKFTVANFISGEFSGELEKYLTDQVPLRDGWVTIKTYMELAIGKRESGGVYICKDKYLMDKFTSYSKKQLAANAAALADLQEKLAAEGIDAKVINIHTIKPLDAELVIKAAQETGKVVTVEEHSVIGGLGSAVCDVLAENCPTKVKKIGINDTYGESGPALELIKKYGLDADSIYEKVKTFVQA